MKLKISITILTIGIISYAVFSAVNQRSDFAPARDFPRGALVYVQVSDLPSLIKLWDESKFKGKYLASKNFDEFQNRHLALKLAGRWQEFSDAAGFSLDLQTIVSMADKRAAVALYDIGKLEFVFISPLSDEILAGSKFLQNQDNFTEQTLDDGTSLYRVRVDADLGRQKQELIFANINRRFILATNEQLLLRTLANINEKATQDRLSDEPVFKALGEKTVSNLATVWVNQTALNGDYYFKRYWLMPNLEKLKTIRAGLFDFALEDGKLIERRRFLLNKEINFRLTEPAKSQKVLAYLPENIPFYHLEGATDRAIDDAVKNIIFGRRKQPAPLAPKRYRNFYINDFEEFFSEDYNYLDENFDENVDDSDEEKASPAASDKPDVNFSGLIKAAAPQNVLTFTEPKVLPSPLFLEFSDAAVLSLASPANFDRSFFESTIEKGLAERVMISAPDAKLAWETKNENGVAWRAINLPLLGWGVSYVLRGDELIIANDAEFLRKIIFNQNQKTEKPDKPFAELTVLSLDRKDTAYDQVFAELARENAAENFFTGNVASLLDSISEIKKIEVTKSYSQGFLEEEVCLSFK